LGSSLVYSTYLGGSGEDYGNDITLDGTGGAYLTDFTQSSDFPVVDAIQSTKGSDGCGDPPCADAFATNLSSFGCALLFRFC